MARSLIPTGRNLNYIIETMEQEEVLRFQAFFFFFFFFAVAEDHQN